MKIEVMEYDNAFQISLTAEDSKEAALLVRMGMNAKTEASYSDTNVYKDGTFMHSSRFPKFKRSSSTIKKNR